MKSQVFMICASFIFLSNYSWGRSGIPNCYDNSHHEIPIDDEQVSRWEKTTPNQFLTRAHIQGVLTKVYQKKNRHMHFKIDFRPYSTGTIEGIYNDEFGALPVLHPGMLVEACGDYITSTQATEKFPASPDGAIIHWIHENPSKHGHPSGFLVIDGVVYGQRNGYEISS